jgi:hypothetical protein
LEGRDNKIVVKELAVADIHSNSVSSYVFKRPYGWEEAPMFNARMNQAIGHGCSWNDGDVLYSELETVLHREVSSAVALYCFGPQKTNFISGLIDRTVIDITQVALHQPTLVCPPSAVRFRVITSPNLFCALRTVYSLAQWLKYYILSLQYAKCPPEPGYH